MNNSSYFLRTGKLLLLCWSLFFVDCYWLYSWGQERTHTGRVYAHWACWRFLSDDLTYIQKAHWFNYSGRCEPTRVRERASIRMACILRTMSLSTVRGSGFFSDAGLFGRYWAWFITRMRKVKLLFSSNQAGLLAKADRLRWGLAFTGCMTHGM